TILLHRIVKGRKQQSKVILLPPYVAAAELRVMFNLGYSEIFRLLNVTFEDGAYTWKDQANRVFKTANKRCVLIPYRIAAAAAADFGLEPKLLDVEPEWDRKVMTTSIIPTVVVLGHIDEGKTSFLDRVRGTNVARLEPGRITQDIRAFTIK
ncbi:unnamed protein product, partial [Amoebophrya sp. A120]